MLIGAQETFLIIINIEHSCAAYYFMETDAYSDEFKRAAFINFFQIN